MRSDKTNETGSDDSESEDEDEPGDNDHEDLDKGDGPGDGNDEGIDEGDGLDGSASQVPDRDSKKGSEGGYKDPDPPGPPPPDPPTPKEIGQHPMSPPDLVALPRLAEASPEGFAAAAEIESGTSLPDSRRDDGELAASLSLEAAEHSAAESERAAAEADEEARSRSREGAEWAGAESERALSRLHDRSKSAE